MVRVESKPDLADALARRNRELSVLNAVSEALNGAADPQAALETTLSLVAELLGLRAAWVWLLDGAGRPYLAASRLLPPFLRDPVQMEGRLCHCLDSFLGGELRDAANVSVLECSRLKKARRGSGGLRYHATIPLLAGAARVGVLNVAGPDWRELAPEELRLLHTIGAGVAVAVERARLAEEGVRAARLEERTRLAREIHDSLAQQLAGIALHLETADATLSTRPDAARDRVLSALTLTRAALDDARRSVADLRAQGLEGRALPDALRALAAAFTHQSGVRVRIDVRGDGWEALPPAHETAFYRVAQEALTNARKHARARGVTLTVERAGGAVRLRVRDDGRGFAVAAAEAVEGFGIAGMRERVELLGGGLLVRSAPGRGTTVEAEAPLSALAVGGTEAAS